MGLDPTLLIQNAKPPLHECVSAERGMGTSQMLAGREPVPLLSSASQMPILLAALLHPLPAPPPRPFFLSFGESSFRVGPIVAAEGADLLRGGLGSVGSHWSARLKPAQHWQESGGGGDPLKGWITSKDPFPSPLSALVVAPSV